jgi:hypothetical protein
MIINLTFSKQIE